MTPFAYIRGQRQEYHSRTIPLMDGDEHSQYETIRQVNFYWRNKYLEDAHDDIIGDYPFDNVSKYRVLLEARATDFDTKHVEYEPKRADRVSRIKAMIVTKAVREYMRDIRFGEALNAICDTRPKYGSVMVKKTKEGIHVVPWENLITDQTDFNSIIIERHYFTPAELKKQTQWENVDEAILTAEDMRNKDLAEGERAETQGDLIEVYELHGEIPVSMFKEAKGQEFDDDDEHEYVRAHIVICGADWNDENEENGLILYAEEESECPYKWSTRNAITGRALGEGVVESLFEHQRWHNFTKTEEMRMIAVAGKKVYWTDDPDILTNVFDEGIDHGTVLRVGQGKTLAELNQLPTGTPVYQDMRAEWADSADRVTSSFNAKIGEEAKSGTPFRAQYLQNVEASSQFEQYREEIGFLIQEIVEDWILPEALKKAAKEDEIYTMFSPQELQLFDEAAKEKAITEEFVKRLLDGETITSDTILQIEADLQQELSTYGNKRHITGIKNFIKDADGCVVVHTTDESRNKAVLFESYANLLQLLAPEDPRRNALIDRIMDAMGISKEELEVYTNQAQQPANPNPQLQTQALRQENQMGAALPITR